jgi:hypothetical protein
LGWTEEIFDFELGEMIPNPETKRARVKREIKEHLQGLYVEDRVKVEGEADKDMVRQAAKVESEDITVD